MQIRILISVFSILFFISNSIAQINQANVKTNVEKAIAKVINTGDFTIQTLTAKKPQVNIDVSGTATVFGISGTKVKAVLKSEKQVAQVKLTFPPGVNPANQMFSGLGESGLMSWYPDEINPKMHSYVINFNPVKGGVNDVTLNLQALQKWDILQVTNFGLNNVGLAFKVKNPKTPGKREMIATLSGELDLGGSPFKVGMDLSPNKSNWKISAVLDKIKLGNAFQLLTDSRNLGLPIPSEILDQNLGKLELAIQPFNMAVSAKGTSPIGQVEIKIKNKRNATGKETTWQEALPSKKETGEAPAGQAKGVVIGSQRSSGWQTAKPSKSSEPAEESDKDKDKKILLGAHRVEDSGSGMSLPFDFLFAIAPPQNFKFVSLGSNLQPLDALSLSNTAIVISSAESQSSSLDVLKFSNNTSISKGLTLMGGLDLQPLGLDKILGIKSMFAKAAIDVTNPQSLLLEGGMNMDIDLSNGVSFNKVKLFIRPLQMNIGLQGELGAHFAGDDLIFLGGIEYKQPATVNFFAGMKGDWNDPIGVKGITLENVEFQLGADFANSGIPLPEAVVGGRIVLGEVDSDVVLAIDSNTPQNCGIDAKFQNMSMSNIIKTLLDPRLVWNNIPSDVKTVFKNASVDQAQLKVALPPGITTKTRGTIPAGLTIAGDVRFPTGLNDDYRIAGLFDINQSNMSLKMSGEMDKIDIAGVFKLSDYSGSKGPSVSMELDPSIVTSFIAGSSGKPLFTADGKVQLLGLNSQTKAEIYANKFKLRTSGKIFNKFQASVDLDGKSMLIPTEMNAKVTMDQKIVSDVVKAVDSKIKGLGGILGTVDINRIRFQGKMNILKGGSAKLEVRGKFGGKNFDFPNISVNLKTSDIDDIAEAVFNELKDEFAGIWNDVTQIVNTVAQGTVDVANDVGDFTVSSSNDFGNSFVSASNDVGEFFESIGDAISSIFGGGSSGPDKYTPPSGTVPIAYLVNKSTKKTIKGTASHGEALTTRTDPGQNDFWVLLPYKDRKHYFIKSMNGEGYIANMGNKNSGAPIKITKNPQQGALWKQIFQSDGTFKLKNKLSGKYLAIASNGSIVQNGGGSKDRWKGAKADYMKPSEVLAGEGKIVATMYYHAGRKGLTSYLRRTSYTKDEFGAIFPSGELSGVDIKSGYIVVFQDGDGKSLKVRSGYTYLGDVGFNDDAVRAFAREYDSTKDDYVGILYRDANYKGCRTYLYNYMSTYEDVYLRCNRQAMTSFKLYDGYSLTLYDDDGEQITFYDDVPNLDGKYESFDDDIDKVKWEKASGSPVHFATLYKDSDRKGCSTKLYAPPGKSSGYFRDGQLGCNDDEMTSFWLKSGYAITLYDNDDYEKNGKKFTSSSSNVGGNLNDDVRKIRWEKTGGRPNTSSQSNMPKVMRPQYGTYYIEAKHSGKVLSVKSNSRNDKANIHQWKFSEIAAKQWILESAGGDYYFIKNKNSGKYMDVSGGNKSNGTSVWQYKKNNTDAQKWKFYDAGQGYYFINSKLKSNFALDIQARSTSDGGNLQMWDFNSRKDNKKFLLDPVQLSGSGSQTASNSNQNSKSSNTSSNSSGIPENQTIRLKNYGNNMYVSNNSKNSKGSPIIQKTGNSSGEKWKLIPRAGGYYLIKNISGNYFIGMMGNMAQEAPAKVSTSPGSSAQWKIEQHSSGWYLLKNKKTGKYLANFGAKNSGAPLKQTNAPGTGARWKFE